MAQKVNLDQKRDFRASSLLYKWKSYLKEKEEERERYAERLACFLSVEKGEEEGGKGRSGRV